MSSDNISFTRENLNKYLNEVAKRYKKITGGRIPAEIILIGGASILANYGFRDSTTDIDAVIQASSAMKEAIYYVSDKYDLYDGWLNDDFKRTTSYSAKLIQYSKYYRTFANILDVRTVAGEYLIAMKLMSGRQYKHDLSDVIGILKEEKEQGNDITLEDIANAASELYGNWDSVPAESVEYVKRVLADGNYEKMFDEIANNEKNTKEAVIEFREAFPEETKRKTANEIIEMIERRKTESKNG